MPVGEEVGGEAGKGNGIGLLPRGGALCLEAFFSLLQVGLLGEVSGEGFSRICISFPGVLFQGHGLH